MERFAREQAPERAERTDTLVWGKNAVTELLKSGGAVDTVYLTDTMPQAVAGYYTALAKESGAVVKRVPGNKLQKMCGTPDHQGVAARAAEEGARYIPICAKTEEDIADYSPEEKKAFLAEMGIEASGLDNLITASYDLLGLISFLTDGKKECRAWTIRKGTKAPQAAGKIHSDFERGFIRASVIGYDDLEANNFDYAAVKAKGLQRTEGKEYVVQDGDVIESRFAVERRNRTIHKRMREYLFELTHNEGLLTSVVPLGDGIAITMKSHEKREETT